MAFTHKMTPIVHIELDDETPRRDSGEWDTVDSLPGVGLRFHAYQNNDGTTLVALSCNVFRMTPDQLREMAKSLAFFASLHDSNRAFTKKGA